MDASVARLVADLRRNDRAGPRGQMRSQLASAEIQRRASEGTLDRDQFERALLALVSAYEEERPIDGNDGEMEAVHAAHCHGLLSHELATRYAKARCPPWSSPFPTTARAGAAWLRVSPDVERFPTRVARSVAITALRIDGSTVPQRDGIGGPLDPLPPGPAFPLTSTLPSSVGPHRLVVDVTTSYALCAYSDSLPAMETTQLTETTQLELPLTIVAANAATWIRLETATDAESAVRAALHVHRLVIDPGSTPSTAIARLDARLAPLAGRSLVYRAELLTADGAHDLGVAVQVPERRRHPPAARQFRIAVEVGVHEVPGDVATIRFSPALDVAEAILAGESPTIVGATFEVTVPIERTAVPEVGLAPTSVMPIAHENIELLEKALKPAGTTEMRACCERASRCELAASDLLAALAGRSPNEARRNGGFHLLAATVFATTATPRERAALAPYLIGSDRLIVYRTGTEARFVARSSLTSAPESSIVGSDRAPEDLAVTVVIHGASAGGTPISLGGERAIASLPIILATPADTIALDSSTAPRSVELDVEWWIDWRVDAERRLTLDRDLWPTPLASVRERFSIATR